MRRSSLFLLLVFLLAASGGLYRYSRPVPMPQKELATVTFAKPTAVKIPWIPKTQAAIGAVGYGVLDTHGEQKAVPIASIAKVVTALAVLEKKPLSVDETSPVIEVTQADVDAFEKHYKNGGSVVPIKLGQKITELEAMQAMLIASANNLADLLARWAFGTQEDYVSFANSWTRQHGMEKTVIADASGYSPKTRSTAEDLVRLGMYAIRQPLIADIVDEQKLKLEDLGNVTSTNFLLGTNGIIGIKTGTTDQAGGCFLFASRKNVSGTNINIVGAVLGAPTKFEAMTNSSKIITTAAKGFSSQTVIKKGQILGTYKTKWGDSANAVASKDLQTVVWANKTPVLDIKLDAEKPPVESGTAVGSAKIGNNGPSESLVLDSRLDTPSWSWRIFR